MFFCLDFGFVTGIRIGTLSGTNVFEVSFKVPESIIHVILNNRKEEFRI